MSIPDDLPRLTPRDAASHKGDFGRLLVVGGSRGMSGAIALTGMAALRSGAGLVTLAVPDACLDTVASFDPSYMTVPLPCDARGRISLAAMTRLRELSAGMTCIACGPGLGRTLGLTRLVEWMYRHLEVPLVLDADALNVLAGCGAWRTEPPAPCILTPHPGEFRRLAGDNSLSADEMPATAVALAQESRTIIVLKGHRTLITDGATSYHNTTGNPGMATGGSGDVLTGIVAALVCQGLLPIEAARLGAHLHGAAGDLAAASLGQVSMTARDLIEFLPQAFQHRAES